MRKDRQTGCSNLPQNKRMPLRLLFLLLLISATIFLLTSTFHFHPIHPDLLFCLLNQQPPPPQPPHPKWLKPIIQHFPAGQKLKIGLVNIQDDFIKHHETLNAELIAVQFDTVSSDVTWRDVMPLWIDETGVSVRPKCPEIPMPEFDKDYYRGLDVVMARLPCGNWSREQGKGIRDVFRLQVSLVVANLAVKTKSSGDGPVFVVFVGGCEPMWEIFRCDDLLSHREAYWLFKPDVLRLKTKVSLPVGACEVATRPRVKKSDMTMMAKIPREAYVTVLHSSEMYVCGAVVLAQSILQTNTTKDLVLLADHTISPTSIQGLESAGWKIKRIERIRSTNAKSGAYNEWNYSKLRVWQLTEYDRVIFIDADFILLNNIDHFFTYPQLSAEEDSKSIFNSGIMVIEPSQCMFDIMMIKRFVFKSYNGGDQGLLNEVFVWWHRLTRRLSYLKLFPKKQRQRKIPFDRYSIHYVGVKPWRCYKDYDCNWDNPGRQMFASDEMHDRWWQVYDTMDKELQPYCGLSSNVDSKLRLWRERARNNSNFNDDHWKIQIRDPRQFNLTSTAYVD